MTVMVRDPFSSYAPIMTIAGLGGLAHNHSCFIHLPFRLLQHALHRAVPEDHAEDESGLKYSDT